MTMRETVARVVVCALIGIACLTAASIEGARAGVPDASYRYQHALLAEAQSEWGLAGQALTSLFAAQLHQESAWDPAARSRYASGLAQFTAETAEDMGRWYPKELNPVDALNPRWALRALVKYDRRLYLALQPFPTQLTRTDARLPGCERWAMTLAAYNGGLGWLNGTSTRRGDRQMAQSAGADPNRWWGHVERYSDRADWAFEENRGYPRRILLVLESRYVQAGWPGDLTCG